MQIESASRDPIKLLESALGKTPEALNAVDVAGGASKLISTMLYPEVL